MALVNFGACPSGFHHLCQRCLLFCAEQEPGVDHRIHYVLDIDWTEVLSWIKAADFGIIPYQVTSDNAFAASPNKMYEFATAGVPIIATSNLPRVKTFVEKYQSALPILSPMPHLMLKVLLLR